MEFRLGTCSSCKTSFRIPASFTANLAKCSKCSGAVEIGPVTSDAKSADKPAAPQQPAQAISAPVADAAARLAARPELPSTQTTAPRPSAARPPAIPAASIMPAKPAPVAAKATPLQRSAPKLATPVRVLPKPSASPTAGVANEDGDKKARELRRKQLEKKSGPNLLLIVGVLFAIAVVVGGLYFAHVF